MLSRKDFESEIFQSSRRRRQHFICFSVHTCFTEFCCKLRSERIFPSHVQREIRNGLIEHNSTGISNVSVLAFRYYGIQQSTSLNMDPDPRNQLETNGTAAPPSSVAISVFSVKRIPDRLTHPSVDRERRQTSNMQQSTSRPISSHRNSLSGPTSQHSGTVAVQQYRTSTSSVTVSPLIPTYIAEAQVSKTYIDNTSMMTNSFSQSPPPVTKSMSERKPLKSIGLS